VLGVLVAAGLAAPSPARAQHDTVAVAGPQYARGAAYRFLFGTDYRALWTAPVRAPLLDLATFAGGLTPTTAGGGFQTKSLRFRGADGYQYGFRSVDKDPGVLPPELDSTFIRAIVQDQISAGHPGAPGVSAPLLAAAGILHADERLVVLPDDPALGQFRERFAGTLGFFFRRLIVEPGRSAVPGAREIIDSRALFPRLRSSPHDRIDGRALLAARLMDVYLGDWDRHRGQWTWARLSDERPARWVPIPEDRDQAFARFDGLLLGIARHTAAPFFVSFGEHYSDIAGQTWNGRDVDRWFLGELDRAAWDSVAAALTDSLSDPVIDRAVRQLPDAWYDLNGDRLARQLRARRDGLRREAVRYYRLLAREAEVHGTAADEDVQIERLADGRLTLRVTPRATGVPSFERTYDPSDTREVRVYLRGGADRVAVAGPGPARILVRVIGDDPLVTDSSRAGGVRFYAADWSPGARRRVQRVSPLPSRPGAELDEPTPPRDWGSRSQPLTWVTFGPDVGLFAGYGVTRTGYGFRRLPWASRWRVRGGWATGASEGRLAIDGAIRPVESAWRVEVSGLASGIEIIRWNGVGNATTVTRATDYYRVNQASIGLETRIVWQPAAQLLLGAGPVVHYSHTRTQAGRIIADSLPYGAGNFGIAGLAASVELDTRDIPSAPTRGLRLAVGGAAYPALWSADSAFGEVHGEASVYLTARGVPARPTLALRTGGKRVFGRYPFTEAAFIGDASTARLGNRNRFAGDAAAWANAELRLTLTRFNVLLPGRFGVFGLADAGRVFVDGEASARWHSAVGGGVWMSVLQPANLLSVALAKSADRTAVYVGAGFAY